MDLELPGGQVLAVVFITLLDMLLVCRVEQILLVALAQVLQMRVVLLESQILALVVEALVARQAALGLVAAEPLAGILKRLFQAQVQLILMLLALVVRLEPETIVAVLVRQA
jgi:hypothetical protein